MRIGYLTCGNNLLDIINGTYFVFTLVFQSKELMFVTNYQ